MGRLNPLIADGQVHGGVTHGIASVLFEDLIYDFGDNLLITSLMDYLPSTSAEVREIETTDLESFSDATITGAKGLGGEGIIGDPAAVLDAVNDALVSFGGATSETPATPERSAVTSSKLGGIR